MHIEISMYKVKISTKRWKVEKLQNKKYKYLIKNKFKI